MTKAESDAERLLKLYSKEQVMDFIEMAVYGQDKKTVEHWRQVVQIIRQTSDKKT